MSDALYTTRLRWSHLQQQGVAKLRGKSVPLRAPPLLIGFADVLGIDYKPQIRHGRIRYCGGDWHDMTPAESQAADAFLRTMLRDFWVPHP